MADLQVVTVLTAKSGSEKVETWRSQDDLDAHLQTPHVQQALGAASDHLAAAPAIHPLSQLA
jgi:quinol monooxygenase YgiN